MQMFTVCIVCVIKSHWVTGRLFGVDPFPLKPFPSNFTYLLRPCCWPWGKVMLSLTDALKPSLAPAKCWEPYITWALTSPKNFNKDVQGHFFHSPSQGCEGRLALKSITASQLLQYSMLTMCLPFSLCCRYPPQETSQSPPPQLGPGQIVFVGSRLYDYHSRDGFALRIITYSWMV